MTPNLFGRWQTRILLLATVGVLVTIPFYLGWFGSEVDGNLRFIYFLILLYVALFGLVWDLVYIYLQKFRWDRDWPAIFQFIAGIWEAIFIAFWGKTTGLLGIFPPDMSLKWFFIHYSIVWLTVFLASQSIMRILFPSWRFRGGKWF